MASDFRISTGLPDHHKTHKVISRLGTGAMWHWVCLCSWTAQNRPSGDLRGMTVEDIEIAAKWPEFRCKSGFYKGKESRGLLVDTFVDVGFLEQDGDNYSWHDWNEHQGWVSNEGRRKEIGKLAADKRWEAKRNALIKAQQCIAHAERITEEELEQSPSPLPSLPLPILTKKEKTRAEAPKPQRGVRIPSDFCVTQAHRDFAKQYGYPDADLEGVKFVDYWTASALPSARKMDWNAAFRTWLSKAESHGARNGASSKSNIPTFAAISRAERYAAAQGLHQSGTGEIRGSVGPESGGRASGDAGGTTRKALRAGTGELLLPDRG